MRAKVLTLKPSVEMGQVSKVRSISTAIDNPRLRGSVMQKRNRRFLRCNPLCAECKKQGRVTAAVECDHVVPLWKGGVDDETNLQGLCIPHHKAKNKAEAAERAGWSGEHVPRVERPFDCGFA